MLSHANFLKRLNFTPYEAFADKELVGNSKKKTNKLTLREFYNYAQNGMLPKQIIESGYDKHIVQFFSALLQNKISLSQEQFSSEYLSGRSLEEIAKNHNISREHTTFLRELYDIDRKGSKYIIRKRTEPELTERQKQIILGTMMGDGGKASPSSIRCKQSLKQKDYLLWKFEELKNIASHHSLQEEHCNDPRFKNPISSIRFYTHANSYVESVISELYPEGVKIVTNDYLNKLDALAVAVWFQDDGSTDWNHRSLELGTNPKPCSFLYTQSFTKSECLLICEWFKNKFDIESTVAEKMSQLSGNIGYVVTFNCDNTEKLIDLVKDHMHPSMKYKVCLESYLAYSGREIPELAKYTPKKCPTGQEFFQLSHDIQEKWVDGALYRIRRTSFPYHQLSEEDIQSYLMKIIEFKSSSLVSNGDIKYKIDTSSFFYHYHHHYYEMKSKGSKSIMELFNDDSVIKDSIRYLISKNSKPMAKRVLSSLRSYRGNKSVGMFPTLGAKAIFDYYAPKDSDVLDFSAGFGQRMVGAWASKNIQSYLGIDASSDTVDGLHNIKSRCLNSKHKIMNIIHGDAKEELKKIDRKFDFVFTSPPYFDREQYSTNTLQSCIRYSNYASWLNDWLFTVLTMSLDRLHDHGVLVLNIANCSPYFIADDSTSFFISLGYNVSRKDLWISTNKYEPILIVQKGNNNG